MKGQEVHRAKEHLMHWEALDKEHLMHWVASDRQAVALHTRCRVVILVLHHLDKAQFKVIKRKLKEHKSVNI